MPSQRKKFHEHHRPVRADAGEPNVPSRYQRALLYGSGAAISIVLALLTGVVLYSTVSGYIERRYTDFAVRKTSRQLTLLERESILRAVVLHEESAWGVRPPPPDWIVDKFAAQHGRIILQQHRKFDPVMLLGDITQQRPASAFAPYLALAREFNYRTAVYTKVEGRTVSGYFYAPDHSFIVNVPAPT
jgi:two-component system capsular synthesis sensor histidine kinase RcsC